MTKSLSWTAVFAALLLILCILARPSWAQIPRVDVFEVTSSKQELGFKEIYYLSHLKADEAAALLKSVLMAEETLMHPKYGNLAPIRVSGDIKIGVNKITNAISFNAPSQDEARILKRLDALDVAQPQVYLETLALVLSADVAHELAARQASGVDSEKIKNFALRHAERVLSNRSLLAENFETILILPPNLSTARTVKIIPTVGQDEHVTLTLLSTATARTSQAPLQSTAISRKVRNAEAVALPPESGLVANFRGAPVTLLITPHVIRSKEDYARILKDKTAAKVAISEDWE